MKRQLSKPANYDDMWMPKSKSLLLATPLWVHVVHMLVWAVARFQEADAFLLPRHDSRSVRAKSSVPGLGINVYDAHGEEHGRETCKRVLEIPGAINTIAAMSYREVSALRRPQACWPSDKVDGECSSHSRHYRGLD
ncbi:hypothetical protein CC78DRAFT_613348 [Lojkania enalia]|uniref:Uncharacterized protein n=1 Tax=Lojkania enalia TaxID=147567 RepID=A0A9P4KG57_9PLEO|nr:hypothetical protein CC78DRAFT_613348 [Didymosphaeria enalia]